MAPTVSLNLSMKDAKRTIDFLEGKAHKPVFTETPRLKKAKAALKLQNAPKGKKVKIGRPKGSKNKKPRSVVVKAKIQNLRPKKVRKATKKRAPKDAKVDKTAVIGSLITLLAKSLGPVRLKTVAEHVGVKGKALGGIVGAHNRWTKTPRIVVATVDGEKQFSLEATAKKESASPPAITFETTAPSAT